MAKGSQNDTKVTRIKASDTSSAKKKTAKTLVTPVATDADTSKPVRRRSPIRATKDYFVGAWREMKQVRWPNRRTTWTLTGALILFTIFFALIIALLDAAFKYLFQYILG